MLQQNAVCFLYCCCTSYWIYVCCYFWMKAEAFLVLEKLERHVSSYICQLKPKWFLFLFSHVIYTKIHFCFFVTYVIYLYLIIFKKKKSIFCCTSIMPLFTSSNTFGGKKKGDEQQKKSAAWFSNFFFFKKLAFKLLLSILVCNLVLCNDVWILINNWKKQAILFKQIYL